MGFYLLHFKVFLTVAMIFLDFRQVSMVLGSGLQVFA